MQIIKLRCIEIIIKALKKNTLMWPNYVFKDLILYYIVIGIIGKENP